MKRMTIGVTRMHRMRSSIYIAVAAFFAGVYDKNFSEPEVTSPWGYPGFWLAGAIIVIPMLCISAVNSGSCSRQRNAAELQLR